MGDLETIESENPQPELPLAAQLEALLFVSGEPVALAQLAAALDVAPSVVERGLNELDASLAQRGLNLQRHAGRVQLTTASQLAGLVERFLGLEATTNLSRAALETLAIVAYQQPVTRPQIDSIRGVNSDSMMKSLLHKNLIFESGRADGPGRPILYSTTPEFLQHFGLGSILEMPPLARPEEEETKQDELLKG
ncbi:MAG: SMC-Scp complex subunit ScpB [Anaerolineaceae bacterium]|jgi:segregation and condensation protein B|nr:SMC-Scp complex subunit ScpB [Anaerolineaceae bacterium]OQY88515.1 MAG: SMC-Scp complex subunit ScpB [Anaerolineae bacterium UTCFX1]